MDAIPIRRLRAELAAAVRRAGHGERLVVSVGGRPIARLGPLHDAVPDMAALVAGGAVVAPRRRGPWRAPAPVPVWAGTRVDQAVREVRR